MIYLEPASKPELTNIQLLFNNIHTIFEKMIIQKYQLFEFSELSRK